MSVTFSNFSFRYASQDKPTLKNINLRIEQGEKILIIGPSGSGKSTLGQCLNGLIPHTIKGESQGQLHINDHNVSEWPIEQYTENVGTVLQDTDSQFVGLTVGEDIAFALENQMVSRAKMYPIVRDTAKMVDLEQLLKKSPYDLSGGQKQRVSLGGILVDDVDILLFDEPLASLDPKTGKATIDIIDDLHKNSGKTVVIIEHRLEDVLYRSVDRIILMDQGEIVADMTPDALIRSSLLAEHGIREPLYISLLKRCGIDLSSLANCSHLASIPNNQIKPAVDSWFLDNEPSTPLDVREETLLSIENLSYSYDGKINALEDVSFTVNKGEFVSILGKNGSGKSTITKLVMGVLHPDQGSIALNGQDLAELSIYERSQKVGVVLQNPNHMISHHMIYDEVAFGLVNSGLSEKETEDKVLRALDLCGLSRFRHWPIDALSYGQKKRVTIASILVLEPELLILDEPTAGQDYQNYTSMLSFINQLNRELGLTVLIISHDMHLVLEHTTRAIVIADSKCIADQKVTHIFSKPELLNKANLTVTSLYELAEKLGITNITGFIQQFITAEHESKKNVH
ncbi:ABC transporter ATP-binding protein [Aliivibrio sp. S4TY2]|uniref:ABC transporter ATP-binding protein n=1 Tax=unclassified Aliivibrio TaxID=2645654 RepID=UPI002379E4E8|nr:MULTISPECIES: ABC transporter ATP-binding protein [unclassified Aliivibrio]MDD9155488.1 ABC transporter ATP-binding protein [Aliivibrio sp. S4TY2]MDD9160355.1 ABC transporter ATP-binding protein [Aliivibrio sp. S4TY1]MDD9164747.1 ABC transporter ATP-binding protein [Aliivibrio sp. S4MY2]MDD9168553.1 ABC transporter ATP-binding protein [Aliivibrio sp. S4MY4]MDD9185081.1 ABC transporter ATP-binding protein [Aliivibrio sp. S4MY3]